MFNEFLLRMIWNQIVSKKMIKHMRIWGFQLWTWGVQLWVYIWPCKKRYSMCPKFSECFQDYWNVYKIIWIHSKNSALIHFFCSSRQVRDMLENNLNFFLDWIGIGLCQNWWWKISGPGEFSCEYILCVYIL